MTTFLFTITLPAHPDSLALCAELAGLMSRYIGLDEDAAEQARAVLTRVLAERIERSAGERGPITISFERPHHAGPVTVEVTWTLAPGEPEPPLGADAATGGGRASLRFAWQPTGDA